MKVYVQYYVADTITGKLRHACGDRAVVQLDGRNNIATWHNNAREFNGYRRPHYHGYQLLGGTCLRDAKPISDVRHLI